MRGQVCRALSLQSSLTSCHRVQVHRPGHKLGITHPAWTDVQFNGQSCAKWHQTFNRTQHNTGLLNNTCMESCFHHRITNIKGTCDFIYIFLTFFSLFWDTILAWNSPNFFFCRYKITITFILWQKKTELHNVKSEFWKKVWIYHLCMYAETAFHIN